MKSATPSFFSFLIQVTFYLTAVKILKKINQQENFCTNVLCRGSTVIMKLTSSLSLGKYLRVGKLWIFTLSTSLAVESIFAITISSRSLNFSPSSSQIGANFLQWPHHGASVKDKKKLISVQGNHLPRNDHCLIP